MKCGHSADLMERYSSPSIQKTKTSRKQKCIVSQFCSQHTKYIRKWMKHLCNLIHKALINKWQENIFPARKTKYDQGSLSLILKATYSKRRKINPILFPLKEQVFYSTTCTDFALNKCKKLSLKKWRVTLIICYKYHLFLTHSETESPSWRVLIFLIQ